MAPPPAEREFNLTQQVPSAKSSMRATYFRAKVETWRAALASPTVPLSSIGTLAASDRGGGDAWAGYLEALLRAQGGRLPPRRHRSKRYRRPRHRKGRSQGSARRRRQAALGLAGTALRRAPMGHPGRAPGPRHGRQGQRHQARDVRRQSDGLRGALLQGAESGRARPRFPMAGGSRAAPARAYRHLQSLLLRGGAGRSRTPGTARTPKPAAEAHHQGHLEGTVRGHQRLRAASFAQRHRDR